jgi:hypothetical protein
MNVSIKLKLRDYDFVVTVEDCERREVSDFLSNIYSVFGSNKDKCIQSYLDFATFIDFINDYDFDHSIEVVDGCHKDEDVDFVVEPRNGVFITKENHKVQKPIMRFKYSNKNRVISNAVIDNNYIQGYEEKSDQFKKFLVEKVQGSISIEK